ncbi:unnamed protein product [Callosobruchus maculatus]|uniref:Methuselah N-terminal domain-containing protein n=1 Tax=Callosobruchus maculatus TaxID=64391 RepID=A0A653BJ53_CALMS|nr:unnamed protein product [Callosobruchus maculatus]
MIHFKISLQSCDQSLLVDITDAVNAEAGAVLNDETLYRDFVKDGRTWGCVCPFELCVRKCNSSDIRELNLTFHRGTVLDKSVNSSDVHFLYGSKCKEPNSFLFQPDPEERVYLQTNGALLVEGLGTFSVLQYCIHEVDGEILTFVCGSEVEEVIVNPE